MKQHQPETANQIIRHVVHKIGVVDLLGVLSLIAMLILAMYTAEVTTVGYRVFSDAYHESISGGENHR